MFRTSVSRAAAALLERKQHGVQARCNLPEAERSDALHSHWHSHNLTLSDLWSDFSSPRSPHPPAARVPASVPELAAPPTQLRVCKQFLTLLERQHPSLWWQLRPVISAGGALSVCSAKLHLLQHHVQSVRLRYSNRVQKLRSQIALGYRYLQSLSTDHAPLSSSHDPAASGLVDSDFHNVDSAASFVTGSATALASKNIKVVQSFERKVRFMDSGLTRPPDSGLSEAASMASQEHAAARDWKLAVTSADHMVSTTKDRAVARSRSLRTLKQRLGRNRVLASANTSHKQPSVRSVSSDNSVTAAASSGTIGRSKLLVPL